ncbi:hypothetical protein CRC_02554 [Cylindrospermopsis raciborskii CS-505]|nr:hypothetical protein CRC_02554 [Cylindrospermopsis raciborskii CS-505]
MNWLSDHHRSDNRCKQDWARQQSQQEFSVHEVERK